VEVTTAAIMQARWALTLLLRIMMKPATIRMPLVALRIALRVGSELISMLFFREPSNSTTPQKRRTESARFRQLY